MANVTFGPAGYSERPYDLYLHVYTIENNVGGNYSRYHWDLYAASRQGYGTWTNGQYPWAVSVGGYYYSGTHNLDFRPDSAGKIIVIAAGDTGAIGHDGNGFLNFTAGGYHSGVGPFGSAEIPQSWMAADRIPKRPGAPNPVGISNVQTTSFVYQFSGTTDGGGGISGWEIQYATASDFSGATIISSSGTSTLTGLAPGTMYYVRSRGYNPYGYSDWSSVLTQTTLPATPPGMAVTPSISGVNATVTLSAPGGVSGVSSYTVERRLVGGSATSASTPTTTLAVTGLTPGATYEYRANAIIGGYTSPWTGWTAVTQPSPSIGTGAYYDGAKAATTDETYAWTGTADASTSQASGLGVTGWLPFDTSKGATGAVVRAAGDLYGTKLARVILASDQNVIGMRMGQAITAPGRSTIAAGQQVTGSIGMKLPRSNRMAAQLVWLNSAGAEISTTVGTAVVVAAGTLTRLQVLGTAPAGTAYAAVQTLDVSGTGRTNFLGGDEILLDGIMLNPGNVTLPYFDGGTPDTNEFIYEWIDTPNSSNSTRTPTNISTAIDPLLDPDCPPVPDPPRPPVVLDECIDDIGVWSRYWIAIPATEVSEFLSVLPTLIFTTTSSAARQIRARIYPNPLGVAPEFMSADGWQSEQVISYMPANTVFTLDGPLQRAYASVAGAPTRPADHLVYGTGGIPATWPELSCGLSYLLSLDTPLDAPAGAVSTRVLLTKRM